LFNVFKDSEDTPDNIWGEVLQLFEDDGTRTKLYYAFLFSR
jgi:hypothetical protein